MSAYACEPGKGSEPGEGWNTACEMAKYNDIWVITRANNRLAIKDELSRNNISNMSFVYYDLPSWAMWWKRGERGIHIYYYLWQLGVYFVAKRLHRKINFDLLHHVTFGQYWTPSFISLLSLPFIWGPLGGGESAPKVFWKDFSFRGKLYEEIRDFVRLLGEHDPFVRATARRSLKTLVSTKETAVRMNRLKAREVRIFGKTALSKFEINRLSNFPDSNIKSIRFISIGRLLHWKGFHYGLQAFENANLHKAEYWVIGDGPERQRLEALTKKLNIEKYVRFFGKLSRENTLNKIEKSHVLIHPSLHDSSGWVCLEAMAMRRPVICLDIGGPALQVTEETGFKIPALSPEQVVCDIAKAMISIASDYDLCRSMGEAGRHRVVEKFNLDKKGECINQIYQKAVELST
jgi:glycosyltransferase involved in cell wall biosynthesis